MHEQMPGGRGDILLATVVICTRNRESWLRRCLVSLIEQGDAMQGLEVLVVDNGSTDGTQQLVERLRSDLPQLDYLFEGRKGLAVARNAALQYASTNWVVFLDDDAQVLEGFTEGIRRHASNDRYVCVGGIYEAWYPEGRKSWFRDDYASNKGVASVEGVLPEDCFASGGIMLLRRDLALAVGGFRRGLGMRGGAVGYGEETRLQVELRRLGYQIGFDPDWRIAHRVAPGKQMLTGQLGVAWAAGRDCWEALDKHPTALILLGVARRIMTRPLIALYRELFLEEQTSSWQSLTLAVGRPLVGTAAELLVGLQQLFRERR